MDSKFDSKNPPIMALFLRVYWMILGYFPPLFVAINILKKDNKSGIMFLLFFFHYSLDYKSQIYRYKIL